MTALENLDQAIKKFKKTIKRKSDHLYAHLGIAQAYFAVYLLLYPKGSHRLNPYDIWLLNAETHFYNAFDILKALKAQGTESKENGDKNFIEAQELLDEVCIQNFPQTDDKNEQQTSKTINSESIQKTVSNTEGDLRFVRQPVNPDGNCGYTAFGITRQDALKLLTKHIRDIQHLLIPEIKNQLHHNEFIEYMQQQGAPSTLSLAFNAYKNATGTTSGDTAIELEGFADDVVIAQGYLHYDVRDKKIDDGWAHPCVLQALAQIQNIRLRIWQLNQANQLVPHNVYPDYGASDRHCTDLLFINHNHFDRLEYILRNELSPNNIKKEPPKPTDQYYAEKAARYIIKIAELRFQIYQDRNETFYVSQQFTLLEELRKKFMAEEISLPADSVTNLQRRTQSLAAQVQEQVANYLPLNGKQEINVMDAAPDEFEVDFFSLIQADVEDYLRNKTENKLIILKHKYDFRDRLAPADKLYREEIYLKKRMNAYLQGLNLIRQHEKKLEGNKGGNLQIEANAIYKEYKKEAKKNIPAKKLIKQFVTKLVYQLSQYTGWDIDRSYNALTRAESYVAWTESRKVVITISKYIAPENTWTTVMIDEPLHTLTDTQQKEYLRLIKKDSSWLTGFDVWEVTFLRNYFGKESTRRKNFNELATMPSSTIRNLPGLANCYRHHTLYYQSTANAGLKLFTHSSKIRSSVLGPYAIDSQKDRVKFARRNILQLIYSELPLCVKNNRHITIDGQRKIPILLQTLLTDLRSIPALVSSWFSGKADSHLLEDKIAAVNEALEKSLKNVFPVEFVFILTNYAVNEYSEEQSSRFMAREYDNSVYIQTIAGLVIERLRMFNFNEMAQCLDDYHLKAIFPSEFNNNNGRYKKHLQKMKESETASNRSDAKFSMTFITEAFGLYYQLQKNSLERKVKFNNMLMAALEKIIVEGLGGIVQSSCASGKDREAIELLTEDTIFLFYLVNSTLDYGDSHTFDAHENFKLLFLNLFSNGHVQALAEYNAPGCEGLKSLLEVLSRHLFNMLSPEVKDANELLSHMNRVKLAYNAVERALKVDYKFKRNLNNNKSNDLALTPLPAVDGKTSSNIGTPAIGRKLSGEQQRFTSTIGKPYTSVDIDAQATERLLKAFLNCEIKIGKNGGKVLYFNNFETASNAKETLESINAIRTMQEGFGGDRLMEQRDSQDRWFIKLSAEQYKSLFEHVDAITYGIRAVSPS